MAWSKGAKRFLVSLFQAFLGHKRGGIPLTNCFSLGMKCLRFKRFSTVMKNAKKVNTQK